MLILTLVLFFNTSYADMGPKDELKVYVENLPDELYCLNLFCLLDFLIFFWHV